MRGYEMGLLRSLFGRKPDPPPSDLGVIKDAIEQLQAFCGDVTRHFGESAFERDAMERQVLSAYSFGGVHVLCQQKGLQPAEGHALCLALNRSFFGYSPEDSAIKVQALIGALDDRSSSLNAIIHRGIDGFLAWQGGRDSFDASDFKSVIATLQKHS
jgi:hypothetical protein